MKTLSRVLAAAPSAALLFALSAAVHASTNEATPGGAGGAEGDPYRFDEGTTTVTVVTVVTPDGFEKKTRTSVTNIKCSAGAEGCQVNSQGEFELVEH